MSLLLLIWLLFPNARDLYVQQQALLLGLDYKQVAAAFEAIDSCFSTQMRSGFTYHTGVLTGGEPYQRFANKLRCRFPSSAFLNDSSYVVTGTYTPDPNKTPAKRIMHMSLYTRGSITHFPIISLDYDPSLKTRSYLYMCDKGSIAITLSG